VTGMDEGWEIDDYTEDDDWFDDDDREPDEPDWGYEEWRAGYEEHCEQKHGGGDCDCRPPLRERLRGAWQRARRLLRRRPRYSDEPPF